MGGPSQVQEAAKAVTRKMEFEHGMSPDLQFSPLEDGTERAAWDKGIHGRFLHFGAASKLQDIGFHRYWKTSGRPALVEMGGMSYPAE